MKTSLETPVLSKSTYLGTQLREVSNWRKRTVAGKTIGRPVTLAILLTASLIEMAESITSLALAILSLPTVLIVPLGGPNIPKHLLNRAKNSGIDAALLFRFAFRQLGPL